MKKFYFIYLVLFLLTVTLHPQQQYDSTANTHINYHRTSDNQQPTSYSQQPKEQVFPLGYGTKYLGKITTGTGVWTKLNPMIPKVDYIGVFFMNPDTGWACGDSGVIIKTTNGGQDWSIAETPVNNVLLKIHSYNGQVVIATGYDGIILRSSDGGETFEQIYSGVGLEVDLWGVQMLNDTLGWVCGMYQTLLKTTDGGLTWQFVTLSLNLHYWSIDFLNEQFGFIAASDSKILRTTNGGTVWQQYIAGNQSGAFYTVDVIDTLHVAAAGAYGKNVYSSDGGISWVQNTRIYGWNKVTCISFINADTGYVIGIGGNWAIRKTTNRGESWFESDTITSEWGLELLPGGVGYAVGTGLKMYKTTGGYDNWERLFFTDNLNDVYFTSEHKGFIIIRNPLKLYKTTNSGIDWDSIPGAPGGSNLLFLDSLTGFIGGVTIFKTTDGGENWYPDGTTGSEAKIFFINSTTGWAISNSLIYKTTDVGETWTVQLSQPPDNFTSIFFVDSLNGWATNRYIWQTTDGGNNWIERTDIPILYSNDVYFTDIDTGFVIESPYLYKTTDSGNTWTTQLNSDYIIRTFGWLSKSHGFIIGDGMYETTDTGSTWNEILELRNVGLRKFQSPTEFLGYSVGNTGLIYKYLDTSYVPVELTSFKGYLKENKIVLEWQTASELNNEGFIIEKSKDKIEWKPIGFAKGYGTTTGKNKYQFYDYNLDNVRNYYRLKQIDYDGTYKFSNIVEISYSITSFNLSQNYPNPFNPSTIIKYSIVKKGEVKLTIYDILGREVSVLVNEVKDPGYYEVNFNASNLASGVYFYRLVAGSFVSTHKMLLLK